MKNQNVKTSKELIEQISVDKLDAILSNNNYTIVDVRSPKGIETQGSIPGSINIPFESVDSAIDINNENYNAVFSSNGPFLFCCTGGVMSYMVAIKLQEKGMNNVCNLEGGHSAWLKLKEKQMV